MAKVIKTSIGDIEISTLTWKQIKEARIFGLVKRMMEAGEDVDILNSISDDDIDRVVQVVVGDDKDKLTFNEVFEIFNAVLEAATEAKK